jgi:O-antigen ligase
MVTAVGRVHTGFPVIARMRPTLLFAVLAIVLLLLQRDPRRHLPALAANPVGQLAMFLIVWATLGGPFAIVNSFALSYWWEEVLRVGALLAVVFAACRTFDDVRRLMFAMATGAALLCALSIWQGSMDSSGRLSGLGGYDPNDLGYVAAAGIPVFAYGLARGRNIIGRLYSLACLGFLLYALVQTSSRGGFLAAAAFLVFALGGGRGLPVKWRVGIATVGVAVMIGAAAGPYWERMRTIFVPEDDYNRSALTGRFEVWGRGIGYMVTNPLLGVGVANFAAAEGRNTVILSRNQAGHGTKWSAPHSSWVQAGAEMGVPGFLAFIGLFVVSGRYLFRRAKINAGLPGREDPAGIAFALMGSLITVAISGSFLTQAFGYLTWTLFGLIAAYMKVQAQAEVVTTGVPSIIYPARRPGWRVQQAPALRGRTR